MGKRGRLQRKKRDGLLGLAICRGRDELRRTGMPSGRGRRSSSVTPSVKEEGKGVDRAFLEPEDSKALTIETKNG